MRGSPCHYSSPWKQEGWQARNSSTAQKKYLSRKAGRRAAQPCAVTATTILLGALDCRPPPSSPPTLLATGCHVRATRAHEAIQSTTPEENGKRHHVICRFGVGHV